MRICSFDIGLRNFAYCIEEFDPLLISSLPKVAKTKRYLPSGKPTELFKPILLEICKNGKLLRFDNLELAGEGVRLSSDILYSLSIILDSIEEISTCDYFLIEQQVNFGITKNDDAVRIQHFLEAYFILNYKEPKKIIIQPARLKTSLLGMPKTDQNGKKTKKKIWSSQEGKTILLLRGDEENVIAIEKRGKKNNKEGTDDVYDTLDQLQAEKIRLFYYP